MYKGPAAVTVLSLPKLLRKRQNAFAFRDKVIILKSSVSSIDTEYGISFKGKSWKEHRILYESGVFMILRSLVADIKLGIHELCIGLSAFQLINPMVLAP